MGTTTCNSQVETYSITVLPGQEAYLYWAEGIDHHTGSSDAYGLSGYAGRSTWHVDKPQVTPQGSPNIRWDSYQYAP